MTDASPIPVYERDGNKVYFVPGEGSRAIVCFPNRRQGASLTRDSGFAESFLTSRGIPGFYLHRAYNDWFQSADMMEMIVAIREAAAPFDELITYGSSMGGYGALRYASALGAKRAVAISPQYSIDPKKVPWEKRWRDEAALITFHHDDMTGAWNGADAYVIYDPVHADGRHVRQLETFGPIHRLPLPGSNHPSGWALNEMGVMQQTALNLFEGRSERSELRRLFHAYRRKSAFYYHSLSRRAVHYRHHPLARELALRAYELEPTDMHAAVLSRCHEQLGDYEAARDLLDGLVQKHPANQDYAMHLARSYRGLRRYDEAFQVLANAMSETKANAKLMWAMAQASADIGRYDSAVSHLEAARDNGFVHPRMEAVLDAYRTRVGVSGDVRAAPG
jgi:pimeloyl-ACP methyl ester carboxylesterase